MDEQDATFAALCAEAQACSRCARMAGKTAVLSALNGNLRPRVLFVAEAPGRQGGDRTRIPMCGDRSGATFQQLLESAGLRREEIFITNAALCNPFTPTGANRPPSAAELRNCNAFLRRTIDVLDPPLVVTLGSKALTALAWIDAHGLTLSEGVGRAVPWYGRTLVPVFHPSPQVLISRRSLAQQVDDWRAIRAQIGAEPDPKTGKSPSR